MCFIFVSLDFVPDMAPRRSALRAQRVSAIRAPLAPVDAYYRNSDIAKCKQMVWGADFHYLHTYAGEM